MLLCSMCTMVAFGWHLLVTGLCVLSLPVLLASTIESFLPSTTNGGRKKEYRANTGVFQDQIMTRNT